MNDLETLEIPTNSITEGSQADIDAVKNLAEVKLDKAEDIKVRRKAAREMLNDTLRADEEYAGVEQATKENEKRLKEIRTRLAGNPEVANLEADIKEMNRQYNEARRDASDYLIMWADKTGQLSFLHTNGNEIKIDRTARAKVVVKKKKAKA